jgi:4-diphosphocytidyl-2-C-methyl-D-erythritol kinase
MIATSTWLAPAKLNLMLRIVGRRPDGYHLLQTVFQFIDLFDELQFVLRDDAAVVRSSETRGVKAGDDLSVRAAVALQQATGVARGVDIRIEKRIPMGAGLGGGSSDAATTLVALNQLWGCGLRTATLMEIGASLGADVPVFIHGQSAWAEGIGEQLSPIDLPELYYALFVPPVHVVTGKVFQDPELTRNSRRITIRDFLAGDARNDCLNVVRARYPDVAQVFDWLDGFSTPRLTGTGCCIFVACADRAQAEAIVRQTPAGVPAFVVRGMNRSTLLDGAR